MCVAETRELFYKPDLLETDVIGLEGGGENCKMNQVMSFGLSRALLRPYLRAQGETSSFLPFE